MRRSSIFITIAILLGPGVAFAAAAPGGTHLGASAVAKSVSVPVKAPGRVQEKSAGPKGNAPAPKTARASQTMASALRPVQSKSLSQARTSPSKPVSDHRRFASRGGPFVVAIDAGHGGKDTGAIGPNGVLEKDVVFAIARKLQGMINAQPNMRAVLVRKGDEFIELRDRAEIARNAKADLLISLHADAYENGEAKGSSVFTLSRSGASSEAARWLANSENASDLVGGVKLKGRGKLLASVLLDLSQNAALEASERAAVRVLRELQKNHHLHQAQVQKAGFVVLKSPDVPSILVETAFISNAEEEKNLVSAQYQTTVARSIFNGIRSYVGQPSAAPALPTAHAATPVPADPPVRFIAQH